MNKSIVEVEGFEDLRAKIKLLPDRVKRTEVLKILRRVAEPALKAAQVLAPVGTKSHTRYTGVKKGIKRKKGKVSDSDKTTYQPGNIKRSLGKIVARRSKINAILDVGARSKKRKDDGYYAHMIVRKGFTGKKRKGIENNFLYEAFKQTEGKSIVLAEDKIANHIQKQINRLSS